MAQSGDITGHSLEKRGHPRYACAFPGSFEFSSPGVTFTPRPVTVQALDISLTGARIASRDISESLYRLLMRDLSQGRLALTISRNELLRGTCELIWAERGTSLVAFGVRFLDLEVVSQAALQQAIQRLAAEGYKIEIELNRPD